MNLICQQSYFETERVIQSNQQETIEKKRFLRLYKDIVTTNSHEFLLENIRDMSFKVISGEAGFLYIHTDFQVFSFYVKTSPVKFMREFRRLKEG